MKRILAVLIAVVVLAACDPAPPPAPNEGGWVNRFTRPDGLPMTHLCGPLHFEIRDNGDPLFREAAVNAVWANMQHQQAKQWVEVPPGQVQNGIVIQNGNVPPGMPIEANEYTDVDHNGAGNLLRATIYIRGERFYDLPDGNRFRLRAVRHGLGHAIGMHDSHGVDSIMDYDRATWDYTIVDISAQRYLLHPDTCFYWEQ